MSAKPSGLASPGGAADPPCLAPESPQSIYHAVAPLGGAKADDRRIEFQFNPEILLILSNLFRPGVPIPP